MFRRIIVFFVLSSVKFLGKLFYSFEIEGEEIKDWSDIRLIAWINHTSLFDILLICVFPYRYFWKASKHCISPIAEKTIKRPLVGKIFGNLTNKKSTVSQKRDDTWGQFLDSINDSSIVGLFPEGRMKRKNGLDKYGNELSIKGGIADILKKIDNGKMLIIYSGGMHHIQSPGDSFPRLFQKVKIRLEIANIENYKKNLPQTDHEIFKTEVINDLTERRSHNLSALSV